MTQEDMEELWEGIFLSSPQPFCAELTSQAAGPALREQCEGRCWSVWRTLRGSDPAEAWAQHSRPHTSLITCCPVWFSFSFSNALQTQRPSFPPSRGFLFPATSQHGLPCCLSQNVLLRGVACLQQCGLGGEHRIPDTRQCQSDPIRGRGGTRWATTFLCPSSCFSDQPFFPCDLCLWTVSGTQQWLPPRDHLAPREYSAKS